MRWHYFGHAMWLAELGSGARVLFDPLLCDLHDGETAEVTPRRELQIPELRPDFVVVSHRHADHFDARSLAQLAALDPDLVLLTSDPFVAEVCTALGFRQVELLTAWQQVELAGATLIATPSHADQLEWGVAVASTDGVVWNHVDSVLGTPRDVERSLEVLRGATGQPVALHLARWAPVLEVEAQLAGDIGFPRRNYERLLLSLAALDQGEGACLVPAAVGVQPAPAFAELGSNLFPVTPQRFQRDLSQIAPGIHQLGLKVGDVLELRGGVVSRLAAASPLVRPISSAALPRFVPFEIARLSPLRPPGRELADPERGSPAQEARPAPPEPSAHGSAAPRESEQDDGAIERWLSAELLPKLATMAESHPADLPVCCALQVRGPGSAVNEWALRLEPGGASISRDVEPDYDSLVCVTHSGLSAVLDASASWGELLLSGQLRACDRAYRARAANASGSETAARLERLHWLPLLFVYAGLGYEESFERAVRRRIRAR